MEWRVIIINNLVLLGRCAKEPEMKALQNGTFVTNFTIAVNRYNHKKLQEQGKQSADFIQCVCFGKTAEYIAGKLLKGKRVLVEGELNIDQYEKDGEKRTATKVLCSTAEVIDYGDKPSVESNSFGDFGEISDCNDILPF